MRRVFFFRPCKLWIPTLAGWLILLVLGFLICLLVMRDIYSFLSPNNPVGARILVVEGWLAPVELDQAIQVFKKGSYERVVTTGGPIVGWPELFEHTNYAQMAANYIERHGLPSNAITVLPTPASGQDRTFLSAVMLRKSAQNLGINLDAVDLISSGAHARRSRLLFQMALGPKVRVGVLAARPDGYTPEIWWKSSSGVEAIIFQSIALMWVKCCFWPGQPDSPQELWGIS